MVCEQCQWSKSKGITDRFTEEEKESCGEDYRTSYKCNNLLALVGHLRRLGDKNCFPDVTLIHFACCDFCPCLPRLFASAILYQTSPSSPTILLLSSLMSFRPPLESRCEIASVFAQDPSRSSQRAPVALERDTSPVHLADPGPLPSGGGMGWKSRIGKMA